MSIEFILSVGSSVDFAESSGWGQKAGEPLIWGSFGDCINRQKEIVSNTTQETDTGMDRQAV